MKIIVEGPNGTGKTTIINKLLSDKVFNSFEVEHTDQYSPNDLQFHCRLLSAPYDMLFDRFYVGETIYPYLHKRPALMTKENCLNLFNEYKDSVILFVDADYSFICKALKQRNEEIDQSFIDYEKRNFYDMYKRFQEVDKTRVFRIKNHLKEGYINEESLDSIIDKLKGIKDGLN